MIYFNLIELKDIEESKSKAHYYAKCQFCKRTLTIQFIDSPYKLYNKSEEWQTVAKFECRGVEIVGFKAGDGFVAKSTAGEEAQITDIDLSDKDWAGYDE